MTILSAPSGRLRLGVRATGIVALILLTGGLVLDEHTSLEPLAFACLGVAAVMAVVYGYLRRDWRAIGFTALTCVTVLIGLDALERLLDGGARGSADTGDLGYLVLVPFVPIPVVLVAAGSAAYRFRKSTG